MSKLVSNPLDVLYDALAELPVWDAQCAAQQVVRKHADLIADVIRAADYLIDRADPRFVGDLTPNEAKLAGELDALKAALTKETT